MSRRLVLLGAGFSRNWNGWLAPELIGELSGRLAKHPDLLSLLRKRQNFELVLGELRQQAQQTGDFAQVAVYEQAIRDVFFEMNNVLALQHWEFGADKGRQLTPYLSRFDAIFTLNQDILLELHYDITLNDYKKWSYHYMPGVCATHDWHTKPKYQRVGMMLKVDADYSLDGKGQPVYKLHGSSNWRSEDGSQLLVMGAGKTKMIQESPLLNRYHQEFSEQVNSGDARVMVIGYSFSDPHINEVLVDAARKSGMKMFVVDPRGLRALERAEGTVRGPNDLDDIPIVGLSMRPLRSTFSDDIVSWKSFDRFLHQD